MPKRHDVYEERTIKLLEQIVKLSNDNRDALPGSVVKKVKESITIMKKRRKENGRKTTYR